MCKDAGRTSRASVTKPAAWPGDVTKIRLEQPLLAGEEGLLQPLLPGGTAGMPAADAADLGLHMTGRYRLPDALRRADHLARIGPPAVTMTARQPG